MREKFFTWVEEKYDSPSQVPERLQNYLRTLHSEGSTVSMLALATNLPEDFVETIVRSNPGEMKLN